MNKLVTGPKNIFDPIWGIIDITPVLPMVDTPEFQALGYKYQLGVTNLLFPAATHTRKQHSFGSYHRAHQLGQRWAAQGMISAEQAKTLAAFGLWHDIGHGPFSHTVEAVTKEYFGRDHDENGARMMAALQPAAEAAGIDFAALSAMSDHTNPLYLGVHDKNLGAEKIDYLTRDAFYTIGDRPEFEYLAAHTYFIDGKLMVDEKAVDAAKGIQDYYVKMYKLVYLRKNSSLAQRMLQKMMAALMEFSPMTEQRLWSLTDFGLMGLFETSESPMVQQYFRRLTLRDLPKTAVELRLDTFAGITRETSKSQAHLSVDEATMTKLLKTPLLATPSALHKVETHIEEMIGLPAGTVVIVMPASPERFVPKDINIYTGREAALLSDYYKSHFDSLLEEGRSYLILRVCAFAEHRAKLAAPESAAMVRDYLLSLVG
jgi:HD superfamily phosphohydrolase